MTFEEIKRRYNRLSSAELEQELKDRRTRRNSTYMVGAADCMLSAHIVRACSEILAERKI